MRKFAMDVSENKSGTLGGSAEGSGMNLHGSVPAPMNLARINRFIILEKSSRDFFLVRKIYVDITGDLTVGVLLSQIVYWHLPDRKGNSRLSIKRDGRLWLAKKREEWWSECRVTPKQFDRAIWMLEEKGIVKTAVYKFGMHTIKHISLNWDVFIDMYEKSLGQQVFQEEEDFGTSEDDCPPGQDSSGIPQRGILDFPSPQPSAQNFPLSQCLSGIHQKGIPDLPSPRIPQRVNPELTKGQFENSPSGDSRIDQRGIPYITKTTTTTTTEINKRNTPEEEIPSHSGKVSQETFPPSLDDPIEKKSAENGSDKTPEVSQKEKPPEYISPTVVPSGNNSGISNSDQSEILALRERYGPEQLGIIDQAMDAFASTRKTYTISASIVMNQLRLWAKIPPAQVIEGLTIYLEKDYAAQGKAEDYALGIIRNVTKQKQYSKKEKGHAPKLSGEFTDSKYAHLYILPKDLKPTGM